MKINSVNNLVKEIDNVIEAFENCPGTSTNVSEIVLCTNNYKWSICKGKIITCLNAFKNEVVSVGLDMSTTDELIKSSVTKFQS